NRLSAIECCRNASKRKKARVCRSRPPQNRYRQTNRSQRTDRQKTTYRKSRRFKEEMDRDGTTPERVRERKALYSCSGPHDTSVERHPMHEALLHDVPVVTFQISAAKTDIL